MRLICTCLGVVGIALITGGGNAEARPGWVTSDLIERSAVIGQFTVVEYDPYAYDYQTDTERTRVVLQVDQLLYGEWPSEEFEFLLPQGIAPDGSETVWSHVPLLEEGETYLLFLQEGEWHVNPVVGGQLGAFRQLRHEGKEILVNDEGRAVRNLNDYGFVLDGRVAERATQREMRRRGTDNSPNSIDETKAQEALARAKSYTQLSTSLKVHIDKFRSTHEHRRESGVIYRDAAPITLSGDEK